MSVYDLKKDMLVLSSLLVSLMIITKFDMNIVHFPAMNGTNKEVT
jgi:hypothetical protein